MSESTAGSERATMVTGVSAALGAFLTWGLFPLYFYFMGPAVTAWEITIHRVVWACLLLAGVAVMTGRTAVVRGLAERPKALLALAGSAALIAGNWTVFAWAVTHNHVLQSSLGYYINPLLNVFLGFCVLGERLRPLQLLAVVIAAAGVLVSVLAFGSVPWISFLLAGCFGGYGLIRKQLSIDSVTGLWLETLFIAPFALVWLAVLYTEGDAAFLIVSTRIDILLVVSGAITIVPLVLFAVAARRLRLGTVGLFQYLTPTAHFVTGVLLFGESFTAPDAVTFGCIWIGLALYTTDTWWLQGRERRLRLEALREAPQSGK